MNNYYFTADKWYGPLPEGILPQYVTPSLFSLIESLPSGDSKIPQFAGMVKEEGKDFQWEYKAVVDGMKSLKGGGVIQTAVPVAEEKLSWQEEVIVREEEGKQTFSESDMIGFAYWVYRHCDYVCDANGREDIWGWETDTKDGFFSNNELLTEYLKTKQ